MTDQTVFRCPVAAMDEWVPSLTLEQWARGDTDLARDCDPDDFPPEGYGGFEPGSVVPFGASTEIGVITVEVENGLAVETPLPPGTTRVAVQYDPENQADTLAGLDLSEYAQGADIVCLRDDDEFWRCTGTKADLDTGVPDTRTFEPATLLDWVNWFDERYCAFGKKGQAARASLTVTDLGHLIWPLRRVLIAHPELNTGSPENLRPGQLELVLTGEGGEA